MQNQTNWLALVVAAVAGMALGFLFYGALFQDVWMAGNGITTNADQTVMYKDGKEIPMSALPMIINTVAMLIYAYLMNWLITKTGETTLTGGVQVGAVVGFIGLMLHYVSNRFAANPTSLSLVDGGYTLVLFIAMGAIIGAWRKK